MAQERTRKYEQDISSYFYVALHIYAWGYSMHKATSSQGKIFHDIDPILKKACQPPIPHELKEVWQGCGGHNGQGQAAVKIHVRWDLKKPKRMKSSPNFQHITNRISKVA